MILRHLADCRATDALREGGRSQYNYVNDERQKRKTHDENDMMMMKRFLFLRFIRSLFMRFVLL